MLADCCSLAGLTVDVIWLVRLVTTTTKAENDVEGFGIADLVGGERGVIAEEFPTCMENAYHLVRNPIFERRLFDAADGGHRWLHEDGLDAAVHELESEQPLLAATETNDAAGRVAAVLVAPVAGVAVHAGPTLQACTAKGATHILADSQQVPVAMPVQGVSAESGLLHASRQR